METLSIWQSLIIAIWIALVEGRAFGGTTLTLRFSPLMTGLVIGLVMGNVGLAMVTATILQLIYLGVNSPGATMAQEPAIGTTLAIPIVLMGNLSPVQAIIVAIPVSIVGAYLYKYRFVVNDKIGKRTDAAIEELNHGEISRSIILYPIIASLILFVPLMFVLLQWVAPLIASLLMGLEGTHAIHVLQVVVNGLIAVGIATRIYVLGKQEYLLFFFLAYVLSIILQSLNVTMLSYAILGTLLAALYLLASQKGAVATSGGSDFDEDDDDDDF